MRIAVVVAGVLLLASGAPSAAQEAPASARMLAGVVRDSATGFPLGGAVVRLGRRQLLTDTAGRFHFEAVPDGLPA